MRRPLESVSVVSVPVSDLEEARVFYGQTLGLGSPWFDDHELGWIEWGRRGESGNFAVTLAGPDLQPGGGTTPVFNTADCHALVSELRGRGVPCDDAITVEGLLTYCTFHDRDGNRLQAVSSPPQRSRPAEEGSQWPDSPGVSAVEIRDVAPGLWIWRTAHPGWRPGLGWEPPVTSTCVESEDEILLLDPLAPPSVATAVWERLDASPPTAVVVLKPDHLRDVDLFVDRYGVRAFGPDRFLRDGPPKTELQPIYPGSELPGGLVALYDGRGRTETPVWLPEQKTLVLAIIYLPHLERGGYDEGRDSTPLCPSLAGPDRLGCWA